MGTTIFIVLFISAIIGHSFLLVNGVRAAEAAIREPEISFSVTKDSSYVTTDSNFNGRKLSIDPSLEWIQQGPTLYGSASSDKFGDSVSVSSDGTRFVIGAPYHDDGGFSNSGQVYVYEWDGTNYTQLGDGIRGNANDIQYGDSVSLSGNGQAFVTASTRYNTETGVVVIFEWSGSSWERKGGGLRASGDLAGYKARAGNAVALNHDATIVAYGVSAADGPTAINEGRIEVKEWDGAEWVQKGGIIHGGIAGTYFGHRLSLSSNGTIFAGEDDFGNGKVYSFNGTDWEQMGDTFYSIGITLSGDGQTIAVRVGIPIVHIRRWDGTTWVQLGPQLMASIMTALSLMMGMS